MTTKPKGSQDFIIPGVTDTIMTDARKDDENLGQLDIGDEQQQGNPEPQEGIVTEEGVLGDTGSEEVVYDDSPPSESFSSTPSSSLSYSEASKSSSAYTDPIRNQIKAKTKEIMTRLKSDLGSISSYSHLTGYYEKFKKGGDMGSKLAAFAAANLLMNYKFKANKVSFMNSWRTVAMDPIVTKSNFSATIQKWEEEYSKINSKEALDLLEERFKKGEIGEVPSRTAYQTWGSVSYSYPSSSSYQSSVSKDDVEEELEPSSGQLQAQDDQMDELHPVPSSGQLRAQDDEMKQLAPKPSVKIYTKEEQIEIGNKAMKLAGQVLDETSLQFVQLSEVEKMQIELMKLSTELALRMNALKESGVALGHWYFECVNAMSVLRDSIGKGPMKVDSMNSIMKNWVS